MQQQISLVFNPISSSGTTAETAQNLSGFLENQGYKTFVVESKQKMSHYQEILHEFEQSSCVLVIGGDGTLRKLLKVLAKSQAPVYMIPGGNESLFAKHFGMTANKELLLSALQRNEILEQYFGVLSGSNFNGEKPFFIMATMGLDSLTVANIGKRTGPINDLTYAWNGFKAFLAMRHPRVTLTVDGQTVVEKQSGYVIIANCPDYAKGINLVPHANPAQQNLDLGFLPSSGFRTEFKKSLHMLQEKPVTLPFEFYAGKQIDLELHEASFPMQVDGDYFKDRPVEAGTKLSFASSDNPIRVLNPVQS